MDVMKAIVAHLDEVEALIIKATGLIAISLFCLVYIRNHVEGFGRYEQKGKRRNKGKRRATLERHKDD